MKNHIDEIRQFHPLNAPVPSDCRLNNPFYYKPDALTLQAVKILQSHLPATPVEGKMWGILIVEYHGEVGFLHAYSGQLNDADAAAVSIEWRGCPAVFDYLQPDGYFKTHEDEITAITNEIDRLQGDAGYQHLKSRREALQLTARQTIDVRRQAMADAKVRRHERRAAGALSPDEEAAMTRESQFLKAEVHRAKVHFRGLLTSADNAISVYEQKIEALRRRRSMLSDRLQSWLFSQFVLLNAKGERKGIPEIFRDYYASTSAVSSSTSPRASAGVPRQGFIPSGSGECCEPKLLQYAYLHDMRPLRIASFWWGPSLGADVRRHGNYYPACSGRCKPIMSWMLQGLAVAENPLEEDVHQKLKIIYDDANLTVVGKPSGMLSVPGKSHRESVCSVLAARWQGRWTPLTVHRLDMATSGLMVVAKDRRTQRLLRRQFENREIEKEYEAIVEGVVVRPALNGKGEQKSFGAKAVSVHKDDDEAWDGVISLPLSPDYLDRPRQKVDFRGGKEATTKYRVLNTSDGETRLLLHPLTGRTHQLRVHCASPLGLNAPIKGDMLYGQPSRRLCLHACRLSFVHPVLGRRMTFTLPAEF